MAGEIASLFVKLGLDARDFTKGVDDANAKTASLGKSALNIGNIAKAGFLAAGAGLAVVTKGAAEAEDAQGKFMAATGRSREEAKAFVSSMDSIAGSSGTVGMSFDQIAQAGTEVARQFQLTGDEGAAMTEQFSEFSKVTGSDTTASINAMDDTLDAFHEPASKATDIMNELIASNQKFGTEVGPDVITMLGKMAPAMNTMGASIDDGVGLLNLMENSGLDTSAALKGIVAASQKMPDGMNLADFLQHLQNLKDQGIDPTSEAVKVFGNKAGVGLANSIIAGQHGLDDYKVSAQDAGDAVKTASDNMLTTGDRVKQFTAKLMAGAREIGQQFGPAITGAASLASLSAPFVKGFAKLGAPAAKAFAKPFTSALSSALASIASGGSKLGARLAAPLTNALTGAFMKLSGNGKIGGAMDKLGGFMGGRLGGGMATAFKAAGILALIALAIDEWGKLQAQIDANKKAAAGIDKATGDYLAGMPSPQEVQAKIDALKAVPQKLDGIQGALYNLGSLGEGNVIGSAFDALFGANPAQVADDKIKQMQAYLDGPGKAAVAEGVDQVAGVPAAAAPDLKAGFDQLVTSFEDGSKELVQDGEQLAAYDPDLGTWITGQDFEDAAPEVQDAVNTWVDTQNKAIAKGGGDTTKALENMRAKITDKLSAIQDAFSGATDTKKKKNISGAERLKKLADDIDTVTKRMNESIKANDPVNTAYWESQLITLTNQYNTAKDNVNVDASQIASDVAAATQSAGADMAQLGNKSTAAADTINQAAQDVNLNPAVKAADAASDDIRESMRLAGQGAMALPNGIGQADKAASAAAKHLAALVSEGVDLNLYQSGAHMVGTWVNGIRSNYGMVTTAINKMAHIPPKYLQFSDPPQFGPLHTIREWGPHMIEAWIGPMERHGMARVPRAAQRLAEYLRTLGENTIGGPHPVHHNVPPVPRHHHRHHDATNPDVTHDGDTGAGVTINVTVQGNIYGAGGTKQLAADLERYIRRSKRGGARLVGAF